MSMVAPQPAGARRRTDAKVNVGTTGITRRVRERWTRVTGDASQRPPAVPGTLRGSVWIAFIAVEYYLLSNPLVFIPGFESALSQALGLALAVVLCQTRHLRPPVLSWPTIAILAFAAMSLIWSISPDDTWAALRLYVLVAVLGVLVASNASPRVVAYGFALGGVIIVVASLYAHAKHLPGADVPEGTLGYMAGVGTNRNILAYSLVPAMGACLALWPRARVEWLLLPAVALVNGLGIYMAESGTGYIAIVAVVASAGALRLGLLIRPYVGRGVIWVGQLVALGGAVTAVLFFERIAIALGKDGGTLSGRVPLWESVIEGLHSDAVVGFGWGAVWPHPWQFADANDYATDLSSNLGIVYTHGHNSFVDVLPQLGWIGVALFVWCYLDLIVRSARRMWTGYRNHDAADASVLVLVTAIGHLALGSTEPLSTIPLGWFILVIIASMAAGSTERTNHESQDDSKRQWSHA